MPICLECGRKAGGFSLRGFNDATGRCDDCDVALLRKTQNALETFRFNFQESSKKGYLTKDDWYLLESGAAEDGLDLNEALVFVRNEFSTLIHGAIDGKPKTLADNQESCLKFASELLALPEYALAEARSAISLLRMVAVSCVRCGAGVSGRASDLHYACSACGMRAVMAYCPHCSIPIHLQETLWNKRVTCLTCGYGYAWSNWNETRMTLGEMSSRIRGDEKIIADPSRRKISGIVLGGSGYSIAVGSWCVLDFESLGVMVRTSGHGIPAQVIGQANYGDVTSLQIGGRGSITTGGGWVGGGFGLTGIVTGALLATALNHATTRSSIETVIYFKTIAGELILFNNQYTPEELRIILSPAFTRIEAAHRVVTTPSSNIIDQLRELGELRASGTITDEEFEILKASVIKKSTNE